MQLALAMEIRGKKGKQALMLISTNSSEFILRVDTGLCDDAILSNLEHAKGASLIAVMNTDVRIFTLT